MKDKELERVFLALIEQRKEQAGRLNNLLDLRLKECDKASGYVEYDFVTEDEWMRNPYGGVHGGIIASVFDTGIGMGACAMTQHFVTTVDLNIQYLRPMWGTRFRLVLDYTHIGNKLVSCLGKLLEEGSDKVMCTCTATFMILPDQLMGLRD